MRLFLSGEGSLHEGRGGLPGVVDRLWGWGAQGAPVWDAARLVVVVPGDGATPQDVLKGSEDRS